jgi:predicted RNA-binding Zn-ribbon protein involved in translation (DUF1610 family)
MDPSPEVLGGLLFAVALGLLYLFRARVSDPDDAPIIRIIHDLEAGICPKCESVHPEAATHTGPHGFWTNFKCPECGYSMIAHVHHRQDGG